MFSRLLGAMNALGTVWIFLLMVLINSDILGRELFSTPVRGTTELLALSIVGIVFLQLGHALMSGRMTRSDMLIENLLIARPRAGRALQGIFNLLGVVFLVIIFWGSLALFEEAIEIGEYVGAAGDFTAPTWPIRLLILIGAAATGLQYLIMAWQDFRFVFAGEK
ncbi:TRAP transporter small permease [Ferrovibrio terrae]|jgi:TRAP-type mannitol/chloroaromatic compound transport system permease small subunit|uniref:TRAP transporter small permease protein n=1 Tax=Ferrovibrio terrae TaxID=2594003 RepID=A0A516H2U5_9PROT|nr:TRAP transporter small permease [Ferrovibrio terrae]QDO98065.1 TRAP transporter small permease [Ferrovibrio terrae]